VNDEQFRLLYRDGELCFFDIVNDPNELNNIINEYRGNRLAEMREALKRYEERMEYLENDGNILEAPPLPDYP